MKTNTRDMLQISLMTALMCVLAPISLPIGPVPISLATFVLLLIVYISGTKKAVISTSLYIALGAVGLPVFSGFQGGFLKISGPTGGYILGYIPMILLAGIITQKINEKNGEAKGHSPRTGTILCLFTYIISSWALYIPGTLWLAFAAHMPFKAAFAAGVAPFIITDIIKAVGALTLGKSIKAALPQTRHSG